jgi:two-component system LytT family response regulator
VLIDDEPRARGLLRSLLAAHPHIAIVGEAGDVETGTALLAAGGYDLVLLDVQLIGGNAFALTPAVIPGARIVFITAHDRYAVRAFEVNALDYILKPVSSDRLAAALQRVSVSQLPAASAALGLDDLVYLKTDIDTARFVRLGEISTILSSENYTQVHLAAGGRLLVRRTLASWEELLPPRDFLRVHRTAFVNLHAITALAPVDRHVLHVTVRGAAESVHARRELLPEIERRLAALGRK